MPDRSVRIPVRLTKWSDTLDSQRVRFSLTDPDDSGNGLFSVEALADGWWSVSIIAQRSTILVTYHLSQSEADSIRRVEGSMSDYTVSPGVR
jgi:hypothetical protein